MTDDTQDRLEERRWLREAAANAAELLEREPDRPAAVIAAINLRAALRQSQDIEAAALREALHNAFDHTILSADGSKARRQVKEVIDAVLLDHQPALAAAEPTDEDMTVLLAATRRQGMADARSMDRAAAEPTTGLDVAQVISATERARAAIHEARKTVTGYERGHLDRALDNLDLLTVMFAARLAGSGGGVMTTQRPAGLREAAAMIDAIIKHVETWPKADDGFLDDLRFVRDALGAAAKPRSAACICGANPPTRPWSGTTAYCRDGNGNFVTGHGYAAAEPTTGLDVEVLARAMEAFYGKTIGTMDQTSANIATHYARLAESKP